MSRVWTVVGGLVLLLLSAPAAPAATVKATYLFDGSLAAEEAGVTALTQVNTGTFLIDSVFGEARGVYGWTGLGSPAASQAGLTLDTTGLIAGNSYSVEMIFQLDSGTNWRRVLDTQNRASDNGLYVSPTHHLAAYPFTAAADQGASTFIADEYYHLVVSTTNLPSNSLRVYLDGNLEISRATSLLHVGVHNRLHFFLDNASGLFTNDFSNGRIALLRLWDGPLTATEVAQQFSSPFPAILPPPTPPVTLAAVPEPSSLAVMALGFLFTGRCLRRRRVSRLARSATVC